MPNSGPVYQPTTESYEAQNEWSGPGVGFLSQTTSTARAKWLQWTVLALSLLGIASGLVMIIEGAVDYTDTDKFEKPGSQEKQDAEEEEKKVDVVVIVVGAVLLLVGLVFMFFFCRWSGRLKYCPCMYGKDPRIVRQLRAQQQNTNGSTMNPSTDRLVTAQYAPVSEIAYQPPPVSEEEETRKLMGSDNKDCILKESNSVITLNPGRFEPEDSPLPRRLARYSGLTMDPPPILVHSPQLERRELSVGLPIKRSSSWKNSIMRKAKKRAPIAGEEEITPSLRSSWNSLYLDDVDTPAGSNSDTDHESYTSDLV